MANMALGFRNRATSGVTVSGGSWLAALPAANVLTSERAMVARSSDALTTSTRIDFDFGQQRAFSAVALCNHNISQAGTWRVTLGTTAGASDLFDSGSQAAWYLPFTGAEEWESGNWWGIAQDEYIGHPYCAIVLLATTTNARYMRIAVTDTANAAGYVQIGRVWAGEVWKPLYNDAYGRTLGHDDQSVVQVAVSGAPFADKQRRSRRVQFSLEALEMNERAWVSEISRRAGTVEEVLYLPDMADYTECQRYGFVGRMRQMAALEMRHPVLNAARFELTEWL